MTLIPVCVFCHSRIETSLEYDEIGPSVWRCSRSRASVVETLTAARPAFALILRWMNGQGFSYDGASWSLRPYDWSPEIQFAEGGLAYHTLGQTKATAYYSGEAHVGLEMEISMLRGMLSTLFQRICVHEFTHAWLNLHKGLDLPKWANEGLAGFMCYHYYTSIPSLESQHYARKIEANRHPDYGGGFARVRSIVQQGGLESVLESLLNAGCLSSAG